MKNSDFIKQLMVGHRKFHEGRFEDYRTLFKRLDRGQNPRVLVICCCDSRVNPALITEADPGDLFLIRNVANLIPPYAPDVGHHGTSAALELAVTMLEVEHVVVMGHSNCGGVKALIDFEVSGKQQGVFLPQWMSIARQACHGLRLEKEEISEEILQEVEQRAIQISLNNLMSYPFIQMRVKNERLSLHGWWFKIGDGQLYAFNPESGSFHSF